jgi:hypothetical protein
MTMNKLRDDAHLFQISDNKASPKDYAAERATNDSSYIEPMNSDSLIVSKGYNPYTHEESERSQAQSENWHIAVNRYSSDSERVQVFVVNLKDDNEDYYASLPIDQVDLYIAEKTGMSLAAVRGLYTKQS